MPATVVFLVLTLVLYLLIYFLSMPPTDYLMRVSDLAAQGDYQGARRLADQFQPRFLDTLMADLLSYLAAIVSFGYLMLLLKAVRGKDVTVTMLLDGFGVWLPVLLLEVLIRLIVSVLLLFLIVPGIFALYTYRMSRYLLIIHPDLGVLGAMRESRTRMRGHRMELFLLDLSYLGWALLAAIPIVGIAAAIWAMPRWSCANILFFQGISIPFESSPRQDRQPPFPPV